MKSSVLVLAVFLLKVLVSSPGGQAQTTAKDPIDHFQPRRQTNFPKSVARVTTTGSFFTLNRCAEACLNSSSCLAFRWPRAIGFSNTCHLYREVGEPIADSTSDLYFKILPTPPATQPTTTRGYTTEAKYVPADDKVGPGVLAGVAIATAVVGFFLGVGVSQLVQWRRSKPEGETSRQADLEEENAVRLEPIPLPRPDQTGNARVQYDVPTESAPRFLRQTSGQYQELRPAEYQGLEHGDENDEEEEYVEPIAREDSTPYEPVDDTYLELQP
ncbi:hypothetical protein Bbelb_108210 [Branchiostoma belcheri]|nr:hypothetical protein Bbelb_108210 [Branchiostoma belcheri]